MTGTFPRDETGAEIMLGDLVFWDGAVWKVTEVEQVLGGYNLTIFNKVSGYKDKIIPQSTTCLGPDTISGLEVLPPPEVKKVEEDDDEEDDRPPQSLIVAPTPGPLFPEFVFKPGDVVYREMKCHRGYKWRRGLVKAVPAGSTSRDDKVMVTYLDGNGSARDGLWPVKDLRRERPPEMGSRDSDIVVGIDRFRGQSQWPSWDHYQRSEPHKTDSISRADLISQEARRLANEDRRAGVMGKERPKTEAPGNGTSNGPKLKTRKGEW